MISYIISLEVTAEQENAIIDLFTERCWVYRKTGLSKKQSDCTTMHGWSTEIPTDNQILKSSEDVISDTTRYISSDKHNVPMDFSYLSKDNVTTAAKETNLPPVFNDRETNNSVDNLPTAVKKEDTWNSNDVNKFPDNKFPDEEQDDSSSSSIPMASDVDSQLANCKTECLYSSKVDQGIADTNTQGDSNTCRSTIAKTSGTSTQLAKDCNPPLKSSEMEFKSVLPSSKNSVQFRNDLYPEKQNIMINECESERPELKHSTSNGLESSKHNFIPNEKQQMYALTALCGESSLLTTQSQNTDLDKKSSLPIAEAQSNDLDKETAQAQKTDLDKSAADISAIKDSDKSIGDGRFVNSLQKKRKVKIECGEKKKRKVIRKIECIECKDVFNTQLAYDFHKNQDGTCKSWTCEICGKVVPPGPKRVYNHLYFHKRNSCTCEMKFANAEDLVKHLETCTSIIRPLKCDICPYCCKDEHVLHLHKLTHHNTENGNFPCFKCPKVCNSLSGIQQHLTSTHRVKNQDVPCSKVIRKIECGECKDGFNTQLAYDFHKNKDGTCKSWTCEICDKVVPSGPRRVEKHLYFHKKNACKCKKKFANAEDLVKHLETCTSIISPFKCEICQYCCKDEHVLHLHKLKHHNVENGNFPCFKCPKVFDSYTTIHHHLTFIHRVKNHQDVPCSKVIRKIECGECKDEFNTQLAYDFHKNKDGTCKSWTCQICGKVVPSGPRRVEKHLYFHKRTSCKCEMKLTNVEDLAKHLETCTSIIRPFKCEICPYSCKDDYVLHLHKLRHHNADNGIFPCFKCPKVCNNLSSLHQHLIYTHRVKNQQDVPCSICGKLVFPKSLKNHEKTHGDRLHQCTECTSTFKTVTTLRAHWKQKHTSVRDYYCEYCGKGCTTTKKLREHLRVHTGEKPYACPKCDYRCAIKGNLRIHMKTCKQISGNA